MQQPAIASRPGGKNRAIALNMNAFSDSLSLAGQLIPCRATLGIVGLSLRVRATACRGPAWG
jgi:hypothetical protein